LALLSLDAPAAPSYHQDTNHMFFWFKRREDLLRYEARQLPSGEFEFYVIDEHGKETVETFQSADALHARQLEFEREIKEAGWTGPHGWNL
jgi:hypothetical protein